MGGKCGTYGEKGNAYGVFVGKPGRKRTLGKPGRKRTLGGPRLRWEHNIKMGLTEI